MEKKSKLNQFVSEETKLIVSDYRKSNRKKKKVKVNGKTVKKMLGEAIISGYFYKSDAYINQLEEFHRVFGHPVGDKPTVPEEQLAKLRIDLISEELKELQTAISDNNKVEILDALCDLQYVLTGAVVAFGYQDIFPIAFDETHLSNMSKTCKTEQEAIESVEIYKSEGVETYYKNVDGLYVIYRTSDNKILKNRKGFFKPNLSQFIKNEENS